MNFTVDWFSVHIPTWKEKVLPRMAGIVPNYLEIGSHEGRSMTWMLENVPGLVATAIDPIPDNEVWKRFIENVGGQVRTFRSHSTHVLPRLASAEHNSFAVIYVDGSHYAHDALFDIVLSWRLLRSGGVMICDDYGWLLGDDPIKSPKAAIDAFMTCYRTQYKVLHLGYQFMVEKL